MFSRYGTCVVLDSAPWVLGKRIRIAYWVAMQQRQDFLIPAPPVASPPGRAPAPAAELKSHGSNLLDVCLRRKNTVAVTVILFVVAAVTYLSMATKLYTSSSRLFVEENGPRLLTQNPVSALERSESYLFRQCQVIQAEPILREAINENPAEIFRMYRGVTDPLSQLQKNLSVELGKKGRDHLD